MGKLPNTEISQEMDNITTDMAIGFGAIIVVLLLYFLIFHTSCCHGFGCVEDCRNVSSRGSDKPNIIYILRFFHSSLDFWTDILFCYQMYILSELFFFFASLLFIILPILGSMVLIIYFIYTWRVLSKHVIVSRRIMDYLNKYEAVLLMASLITSFPATMLLTRSKLFYFNVFYFPLTQEEFDAAIMFRVINVTLLEVLFF